jgi:tetratricopeptide (TPR) repeat protein
MKNVKKLTVALFAGTLLFCGCSRQETHPMTRALQEASEGNWEKADKPSAEALKKTPDNVNALILRAVVCERLERYDEAVENARKAVNIDSNSFAALYTLGRLYAKDRRRRSDAVNLLFKASRLRPDQPSPYPLILLANLHPQGQKGSYLAALSRIPGYANAPEVLFESAMDRVYNRDRKGVEALYARLLEESYDMPELYSAIGGYFDRVQRRPDLAKKAYLRYLSFSADRRQAARSSEIQKRLRNLR